MRYRAVFFDLDGTIADSAPGILGSMQYALDKFGLHPTREQLRRYLGPPLQQMFADFLPPEQVAEGVRIYREYYGGGGLFDARIYDGIPEAFRRLSGAGVAVCLATAKPRDTALRVLDHFDLTRWFALVGGTDEEAGVADKTAVIRKNMRDGGFAPQDCLMVGIGGRPAGRRSGGGRRPGRALRLRQPGGIGESPPYRAGGQPAGGGKIRFGPSGLTAWVADGCGEIIFGKRCF